MIPTGQNKIKRPMTRQSMACLSLIVTSELSISCKSRDLQSGQKFSLFIFLIQFMDNQFDIYFLCNDIQDDSMFLKFQ